MLHGSISTSSKRFNFFQRVERKEGNKAIYLIVNLGADYHRHSQPNNQTSSSSFIYCTSSIFNLEQLQQRL
jgi:hypothetical protein